MAEGDNNNNAFSGGLPGRHLSADSDDSDDLIKLQAQYNSDDNMEQPQEQQNYGTDDYNPFEDDYNEEEEEKEKENVEMNVYANDDSDGSPPPPPMTETFNNLPSTPQIDESTTNDSSAPSAMVPMEDRQTSGPALGRSPIVPPPPLISKLSKKNIPPPPPSSKPLPYSPLRRPLSANDDPGPPPPPPSYAQSDPNWSPPPAANIKKGRHRNKGPVEAPKIINNKHVVSLSSGPYGSSPLLVNGGNLQLNDDFKSESIDKVSFTDILRQVDIGVEMTDRLKEVIRKFCKHQQMGADKLQEIYGKLPSTYQANDGMKEFADLCALVHTLILETVSAQKRMADFLYKDIVPKMDSYIKEKQQQIQHLKRDNQQAEMKLKNSVNAMNKAANTARSAAVKAKQAVIPKRRNTKDDKKGGGWGRGLGKLKSKMGGKKNDDYSGLSEGEIIYMKAANHQKNYEGAVMAANHEQKTYYDIQARFKRDCRAYETQRMNYCNNKISQFINAHRQYFNDEKIMVLQTRVLSSMDALDQKNEFSTFLNNTINDKGKFNRPKEFETKKFDYQNVFHSLQDSMDITNKLAPHARLPLMLTTLCDKIRGLNGFETQGIFRKSAMATEIDRLKIKLSSNNYEIDTKDPHVPACLLKDWLRGLNDSLIPQSHYDICISMAKKNEVKAESLEVFLSQLPEVNRETIKYLVKFLKQLIVPKYIDKTKMNLENVSIVFAPTILKCPHKDPQILLANSRHEKTFTIALITELSDY